MKKTVGEAIDVITDHLWNSRFYWFMVGWLWGIGAGSLLASLF